MNSKIKLMLVSLFLLLFLNITFGQNYSIYLHEINITISNEGQAEVVERFNLFFPNDEERVTFRTLSTNLGSDLAKWAKLNEVFNPNIGNQNLLNKQITYNETDAPYLELRYKLVDSLMAKGKENPNNIEYTLKAVFLDKFFQTNVWVIPENTEISFILPPRAEIIDIIEPEAEIINVGTNPIIKWRGYKSANRLTLKYIVWNAPQIAMDQIINKIFYTFEGQILIAVFTIIIVFIFIERKKISGIIEDYIAENSEFEKE
jgi:hypothetical protein